MVSRTALIPESTSLPFVSRGVLQNSLPQRIMCSKCGDLLYAGLELETPSEVIQRNGGYCPKCGKKLGFDTETLKIIPQGPFPGQTN